MRNAIFLKFSNYRAFWNLRAKFQYCKFLFERSTFSAKHRVDEGRTQTATFLQLAAMTRRPLVIAVILVACLQVINPWLTKLYGHTGLTIDEDTYSTLLGTIAATGGVLIGLYYAAITAIGGAIYSTVPNNVRDLLAQDRVGNVYMRFLAFSTFSSILLLGLRSAGLQPNLSAVLLLLFGAGVSVIIFVRLGARAFYLFDPTSLSFELVQKIKNSYLDTRPGKYRWDDPSFQNYAYEKARLAVDTTETLAEITSKQTQLSGEPFVTFCSQLLLLLREYASAKKYIPSESRWYPRRYVHPDWYRTDDSTTSLVFQTGGRLNPKEVSDGQWLESAILPIIHLCFRKNAEVGRYDLVTRLVNQINKYAGTLSSEHDVKAAFKLIEGLTTSSSDLMFRRKPQEAQLEPIEQLALVDSVAAIPVTIFLAYANAIRTCGRDKVVSTISAIRWSSNADIYEAQLPIHIVPQLEWMYPRIDFEKQTEGFRTSPNWYLSELAIQPHLQNLKDSVTALVEDAQALFDKWLKTAEDAELFWIRANLLNREVEYWHKFEYQFHVLTGQNDALNADRRIDGLDWPKIDLVAIEKKIEARKRLLLQRMAQDVMALSAIERPEAYPDFAGQFLHAVAESLAPALVENDSDLVKELFPHFFMCSFLQYDRIGAHVDPSSWRAPNTIKIAVAPVLDLMSLSGYGLLMAAYYDNPALSSAIVNTWNAFLDERKASGHDLMPFLSAAIGITDTAFEIAHRSMIRMSWDQMVAGVLRKLPRQSTAIGRTLVNSPSAAVHKSPLVRVMAVDEFRSMPFTGIDIFVEEFLRKRPDAGDMKFGSRSTVSRELARAIERETLRQEADQELEEVGIAHEGQE